jgi:hypothetical protein
VGAGQEYPDVEIVLPGQTVGTLLRFLSPQAHLGRANVGMEFQLREGARVVDHFAHADSYAEIALRRSTLGLVRGTVLG